MKRLLALIALVFTLSFGNGVQASVGDTLLLYFPNRIVDFMDIFSLSLGFGPVARADVWCTRDFSFGAGVGAAAKAVKQYNRQYGLGLENGWEASFMVVSMEDKELSDTTRLLKAYKYYSGGTPSPYERIYNFHEGERDFWSIGVQGAALGEVDAEFHPVELADFFTGFFFIDLKGDDFTGDDLRW